MKREGFQEHRSALWLFALWLELFTSEGPQKFLYPAELGSGRFAKIGIPFFDIVGPSVGWGEMLCGMLILAGCFTRDAGIPLLLIMFVALLLTKLPGLLGHEMLGTSLKELSRYGLLSMLHEARTDICMVCGLINLWIKETADGGLRQGK